jgi:hypothetical protein
MSAQLFQFMQMSAQTRWQVAVAASLILHVAVFALLSAFILVDGSLNISNHRSGTRMTVNITGLARQELPGSASHLSKPVEGGISHQPGSIAKPSSSGIVMSSDYLSASELDVMPVIRRDISAFPEGVENLTGIAGKVVVGLWIDESGHVARSELIESELPAGYGDIAARAFLKGDFKPGMKDGRAVKSRIKIVVFYSSQ